MRISQVLANKGVEVATISKAASVADAVYQLARYDVGALVVSDDGQHIDGIVSERDIVRRMGEVGGEIARETVGSIMSLGVHVCTPEDDTEELMTTMTERRVRHVPVVVEGLLVGIVSIGDVVKARMMELERDRKELEDYITAR